MFFKLATHLGEGLAVAALIVVLLLFKKRKKATALLLAYLYAGILVQIIKRWLNFPRPKLFLEQAGIAYPNFFTNFTTHSHHSFPSGHTASVFATTTVLVLVFKKHRISTVCLLIAVITGYSRIYLGQHFPLDVVAGGILGTCCAIIAYDHVYRLSLLKHLKFLKKLRKNKLVEAPTS